MQAPLHPPLCAYIVTVSRHYIARLQGQPILVGIFVDETYDIGR